MFTIHKQTIGLIHNMQCVPCDEYSKSCVHCTKIIIRIVNCDVNK